MGTLLGDKVGSSDGVGVGRNEGIFEGDTEGIQVEIVGC